MASTFNEIQMKYDVFMPSWIVVLVSLRSIVNIRNCMEQSPSWEADSHSAGQEIPRLLWGPPFITVFTGVLHWALC